jgi:hypothetical protein
MTILYITQIDLFGDFCTNLYHLLVTTFPWAPITPSIHKVLAHSPELLRANDNFGLGQLSEGPLEGQHKHLRRISINLARNTSLHDNLTDTFTKIWIGSDPMIRAQRPEKTTARVPQITFNYTDDILVKSFFV